MRTALASESLLQKNGRNVVAPGVMIMFRAHPQYNNGRLNRVSIVEVGVSPRFVRMAIKRKMLDRGIRK